MFEYVNVSENEPLFVTTRKELIIGKYLKVNDGEQRMVKQQGTLGDVVIHLQGLMGEGTSLLDALQAAERDVVFSTPAPWREEALLPDGTIIVMRPSISGGPKYLLEKRENHDGQGYHAHILVRSSSKYERTGYLITMRDGTFYVVKHGNSGETRFDITKAKRRVTADLLKGGLEKTFKGIAEDEMLPVAQHAVAVYSTK